MSRAVGFFRTWYGGSPLHLLVLAATFCIGGYAASRIYVSSGVWLSILVWFVCCILGHDVVLWPVYTIADRVAGLLPAARRSERAVPWINHLRIPVALSALLLLIFFPLIFKKSGVVYEGSTGISLSRYLPHWAAITAALFIVSAVWYALRVGLALRRPPATTDDLPG